MSKSVQEIAREAHLRVPDDIKVERRTAAVYARREVWVDDPYQRTMSISGIELPLGGAATSQITRGDLLRELMKEFYIHADQKEIKVYQFLERGGFNGEQFILSCRKGHLIMTLPTEHYFGVAFPVEGCDEPEYHLAFLVHEGDQVYYYFPADGERIPKQYLADNKILAFDELNADERAEVVARVLVSQDQNMIRLPEEINAPSDGTGKYAFHWTRLAVYYIPNEKQIRVRPSMGKSKNDHFTEPGPLVLKDIQDLSHLLHLFSVTSEETRFLLRDDSQIERFCRDVKEKGNDDFLKEKCKKLENEAKKYINNTLADKGFFPEEFFPESGRVISLCIWNHYRLIKKLMENTYSRRSTIVECNDKQVISHGGIRTDCGLDEAEEEEEEQLLQHEKTGRTFSLYDPEKAVPGSDPFIDKSDFELYQEAIANGALNFFEKQAQKALDEEALEETLEEALDEEALEEALEEPPQPPDESSNSGSKRPRDDEGSSPDSDEEARQDKRPRVKEFSKPDSVIPANSVIPTDPPQVRVSLRVIKEETDDPVKVDLLVAPQPPLKKRALEEPPQPPCKTPRLQ